MSVGSLAPEASVSANSTIRATFRYNNKISVSRQFICTRLTLCGRMLFGSIYSSSDSSFVRHLSISHFLTVFAFSNAVFRFSGDENRFAGNFAVYITPSAVIYKIGTRRQIVKQCRKRVRVELIIRAIQLAQCV